MRRIRVIVGMTGLILAFHTIYFDFKNLKDPAIVHGRENDHVKVTELRVNMNCAHCQMALRKY